MYVNVGEFPTLLNELQTVLEVVSNRKVMSIVGLDTFMEGNMLGDVCYCYIGELCTCFDGSG
jgi:hypothetical protein